jgi:hypothetical protein
LAHYWAFKDIARGTRLGIVLQLGAWSSAKAKREIKSPKIHLMGLATALRRETSNSFGIAADPTALGALFETFVFTELEKSLPFLHACSLPLAPPSSGLFRLVRRCLAGALPHLEIRLRAPMCEFLTVKPSRAPGAKGLADPLGRAFCLPVNVQTLQTMILVPADAAERNHLPQIVLANGETHQ